METLKTIGSWIGSLILAWGFIGGYYHSITKHDSGDIYLAFMVPPYAWYRSVEMLWHDDWSGVDWPARRSQDLKTCIYFLKLSTAEDSNVYELNNNVRKFAESIKDYPAIQKDSLKEGVKLYVDYQQSLATDFRQMLSNRLEDVDIGEFSYRTTRLEKELSVYGLQEILEETRNVVPEALNQIDPYLVEDVNLAIKTFDVSLANSLQQLRSTYKDIFNEEL
ncbi:MAG: hypothetical protein KDI38_03695 [Calditrichaeota bacterium]|nr:hypothetical protein [Calditrichota bacterium]